MFVLAQQGPPGLPGLKGSKVRLIIVGRKNRLHVPIFISVIGSWEINSIKEHKSTN